MSENEAIVHDIITDPEFQGLIPPLTNEEQKGLEENLLRDGCLEPLIVWREKHILLDGHHRKEICERHNIDYGIHEVSLPSHEAAADWIDANQLGRRNLTPEQMSLLRGRRYNRVKKAAHRPEKRDQNDPVIPQRTADKLAKEHGVSAPTIKRDGQFAEAVGALGLEAEAAEGSITGTRQEVVAAGKALGETPTPEQVQEARHAVTKPHVSHNSGENEWYTPDYILERVKKVLGTIDIDPASTETANETVEAKKFFSIEDDGLAQPWSGRVFLNPPYAQPLIRQFCEKLVGDYQDGDVTEAIVLVNNATETQWFQTLLGKATAICFPAGRVRFWKAGGISAAPLQGQAIVYFGKHTERFAEEFKDLGKVCHVVR